MDRYSSCFYDEEALQNLHRFVNLYSSNCKIYFCGSIGAFGQYEKDNGDLKYIIRKSNSKSARKRDIDVNGENGKRNIVTIEDKY